MKKNVIAIDGTSASGKGTLAKRLAAELGFAYLDTGKLYRYIGFSMLENGDNPENKEQAIDAAIKLKDALTPEALGNAALSSDEAGQAASKIAIIAEVRAIVLAYQRHFAQNPPNGAAGAVLDGRDIGTETCPDATIKLYIDADMEIRAKRRHKELQSKGNSVTYYAVLADMRERDARDSNREISPLKPAVDAIIFDTSEMSIDEVLETALSIIRENL